MKILYAHHDPTFNILLLEKKTKGNYHFSQVLDETARVMNTHVFHKFPIDRSISFDAKSCTYVKATTLHSKAISEKKPY